MRKWCLITGASGDIGAAIAESLATRGYSLMLHYYLNKDKLLETKEACEKLGADVFLVQADLSKQTGPNELISQLPRSVDAIVHNCGSSYVGLLTDMTDEQIERMVQLHLTSTIQLTKSLLPSMLQKRAGHIVVVSSIWGLTGASCEVVYSTVKGGLNAFVKALAKEVAPSNLYVNGVAPGAIDTKMMQHFDPEEKADIMMDIPMGRLGKASEIADATIFLLSEQSSYINGQILSVNGGWHC
ncbi:MAG TPA: SDR family oxidoreductase [Bacilli bacterium]|nr:SDR family oxidoreductase [Bacilli bacterium]